MKRYEKAGLVTGRLGSVAPAVLQRMRECEQEVPLLVTRALARA